MQTQETNLNKLRARIFHALSDPNRLEIIEFLMGGEKCVCEIIPHLELIQPVVSRHLKILKDCGIVFCRKDRNRRLYSLTDPKIYDVLDELTPEMISGLSKDLIEQMILRK